MPSQVIHCKNEGLANVGTNDTFYFVVEAWRVVRVPIVPAVQIVPVVEDTIFTTESGVEHYRLFFGWAEAFGTA